MYLLFFGRIHPDKGVAEAIAMAQRAHMPLYIARIIHQPEKSTREGSLGARMISTITVC
jgi:hypothetical protein